MNDEAAPTLAILTLTPPPEPTDIDTVEVAKLAEAPGTGYPA
jgi:hypothetical protein